MRKLLFSAIFLFSFAYSHAVIKTVIGNSGLGWANPNNWSPTGVPTSDDEVVIPGGQTISVKGTVYSIPYPTLIIKVYGTLDFDPSGKLDLSASSILNVYSGGQITSSGTSSELIILGGVTKYNGQNDGSLSGPIYASSAKGQSTAGTPGAGFNAGVLPVKLTYFNYSIIGNSVKLSWRVIQNSDQEIYIVQSKSSSNSWVDLQTITASGLTGAEVSYSYTDASPSAETFYRLKLIDRDGQVTYSRIILVKLNQPQLTFSAFPNPAKDRITISWHKPLNAKISIYNAAGMLVKEEMLQQNSEFQMNTQPLQNGNYVAVLSSETAVLGKILFTVTH